MYSSCSKVTLPSCGRKREAVSDGGETSRTAAIYIAVSFNKCTLCKSLWMKTPAKRPKLKCHAAFSGLSNRNCHCEMKIIPVASGDLFDIEQRLTTTKKAA